MGHNQHVVSYEGAETQHRMQHQRWTNKEADLRGPLTSSRCRGGPAACPSPLFLQADRMSLVTWKLRLM